MDIRRYDSLNEKLRIAIQENVQEDITVLKAELNALLLQ